MSSSIKTDKSKTLTMVGMGIMVLLVLTKVVPTSQFAQYSLFVGLAFFFIVEGAAKTPDTESDLRFNTFLADLKNQVCFFGHYYLLLRVLVRLFWETLF